MLSNVQSTVYLLALLAAPLVSAGAVDYAAVLSPNDVECQRYCSGYKEYIDWDARVARSRNRRYGSNEPETRAVLPVPENGDPGSSDLPCRCDASGSLGCWYEGTHGRALPLQYINVNMTVQMCESYCAGYRFYGLEFADECYCGNSIIHGAYQAESSSCDTPCGGNSTQICGGSNLLSLYLSPPPNEHHSHEPYNYESEGCYAEPGQGRALQRVIASTQQTLESCFRTCSNGRFRYAGLESGQECWCGRKLNPAAIQVDKSNCNMACPGNPYEKCGGPLALSLYKRYRGA